jgi:hypothetical protein
MHDEVYQALQSLPEELKNLGEDRERIPEKFATEHMECDPEEPKVLLSEDEGQVQVPRMELKLPDDTY